VESIIRLEETNREASYPLMVFRQFLVFSSMCCVVSVLLIATC
jgi:hypothetical protein